MRWRRLSSCAAVVVACVAVVALVAAAAPLPQRAAAAAAGPARGIIVETANQRSMGLAHEAGFTLAKMILGWPSLEPTPGTYQWDRTDQNDFDNILRAARAGGMRLVVRVDGVPAWAGSSPASADLAAVERFYAALAHHGAGTVAAYEILNEPNLPQEWGGPPSPAGYTAFLGAAYRGIKAGDATALVLGGGPAPSTGGLGGTIEDTDFLDGMYDAGAQGVMDALAIHNYGGNSEPERDPRDCGGICFRRAEIYRDLMLRHGDADRPIWSTEWGYLMDPGRPMGQYDWMKVSAPQQADYLVRAYRYAAAQWPWMGGLVLSNLDASTTPYHTDPGDAMPWFAILNADYSPRPAWDALKALGAAPAP